MGLDASGQTWQPARALVPRGFLPDVVHELALRGIPICPLEAPLSAPDWERLLRQELRDLRLSHRDLVVGLPNWVEAALAELGVAAPPAPDYPECVRGFLRRATWRSTLAGVRAHLREDGPGAALFVKPASGAKSFNGDILHGPDDPMLEMWMDAGIFPASQGPDTEVFCGEVVRMNSEYAVYVVNGEVRSTSHYACKRSSCRCAGGDRAQAGEPPAGLDENVVAEAVRLLSLHEPGLSRGCRMDFALVQAGAADDAPYETALVEVNDGYVAGRYEGCSVEDYTDMILARFGALVGSAAGPGRGE